MFRLVRLAILAVVAFAVAAWIRESAGAVPQPADYSFTLQSPGDSS